MISISVIKLITMIFFVLYLPRMLCWFASFKKQPQLHNEKQNKLAVIIPARNEGTAVIPLLESLKNQTYAKNNFDVFIVVKEPDDPVHEYAKIADATVYVDQNQTCKGDCLDFCLKKILTEYPKQYDAFVVIDADCVVAAEFLEEMNNAMASGADVINGKKLVKNYFQRTQDNVNLVAACNGLIWTFMDDMGNRWKSDHNFTTMTVTTGILFRRELVEKWNGWIYKKTLTEDMELQRDCALQGYKTFYYSHAKLFMEESPSITETNKRRTRWMTGLTGSDFIYAGDLLRKKGMRNFMNNYFMFCLWLVYAYAAAMIACFAIGAVSAGWMFLAHDAAAAQTYMCTGIYALLSIYTAFFILSITAIIVDWDNIKLSILDKIILAFVHPLFYMWYIKIVAKAIFIRTPQKWETIERIKPQTEKIIRGE
ncbi:MAG: glycosyltransferase [Bacteroides sp.]|nr:glycosyltransferase [Prevotella sp.]MCM1407543.1 glycosyltransferase [Treponema brennaborense]MCM1469307.1 glycosyltransferase [Bacteroides sp.]